MQKEIDMAVFAKRLKEARAERGLTQKELAAMSGVSTVMISSYERTDAETGKNPALSSVFAIANALDVSIDWLCGITEQKNTSKEIDTTVFLCSYLQFFNRIDKKTAEKLRESMKSSFDGISIQIYKPIFGANKSKCLYHFTKEYLEVFPVLKNSDLPAEIVQTIIEKIIDKYKDIPINQLLSDGFDMGLS